MTNPPTFDRETWIAASVIPKNVVSPFLSGMLIEEGSAAPVPLWITSPPFGDAQAEKKGGVEGWRSGIGHGICVYFFIPFGICPLIIHLDG